MLAPKIHKIVVLLGMAAAGLVLAGMGVSTGYSVDHNQTLLGLGPEQLLERLGVPDSISPYKGAEHWAYFDGDGKLHKDAILLCGDFVVSVKPEIKEFAGPNPIPVDRPYPGQRVDKMVALLGQPDAYFIGQISVTMEYEDCSILVREDRVADINKK